MRKMSVNKDKDNDLIDIDDFGAIDSNKQNKHNFLFISLLPLLGILIIGLLLASKKISLPFLPTFVETKRVTKLPARVSVTALGYLKPKTEIISVSAPIGERIDALKIKEGDFVKQNDVLAYLDSHNEAKAQVEYVKAQLKEIKEQIKTDILLRMSQIESAKSQKQEIDAPKLLRIKSQQALINRLKAEEQNTFNTFNRYKYLHEQGAISRQELENKKLQWDSARENLKQSQLNLQQMQKSRELEIRSALTNINQAIINERRVLTHTPLKSIGASLRLAQSRLERTIVKAPISGQILKVFTRSGEAISEKGILQIGDTSQMNVIAEVYETDIKLIKKGQIASITSPAFEKDIIGSVISIGKLVYKNRVIGDNPASDADARVVEVKIRLENSKEVANLSNLRVDVKINLGNTSK